MTPLISTVLVSEPVDVHCPVCGQRVANTSPGQEVAPCEHLLIAAMADVHFSYLAPCCKELGDKAISAHSEYGIHKFGFLAEHFGTNNVLYFTVEHDGWPYHYAFALKPVAA